MPIKHPCGAQHIGHRADLGIVRANEMFVLLIEHRLPQLLVFRLAERA